MQQVLYAAYGSNLHPVRLRARIPSAELIGTAYLPDWALTFNKRSVDTSAKCNIQQPGCGLYVAIYNMSASDKRVLDGIEGVGNGYADASLQVPEFGECRTYIATDSHIDECLVPYDWYREIVILGCNELGLPVDYVSRIERTAVIQDPDPQRHQDNWNVVRMLRGTTA